MKFFDLQKEYSIFFEHLYLAQESLISLIKNGDKFLTEYNKNKDFDQNFACKIDAYLYCLNNFIFQLDDIIESLNNCSLTNLKLPNTQNSDNENNSIDNIISVNLDNL